MDAKRILLGNLRSQDRDFFFQAEDGIRDLTVTGVQTCALPISDEGNPSSMLLHALGGSTVLVGNILHRGATCSVVGPMLALSWGEGTADGKHYEIGRASCRERV